MGIVDWVVFSVLSAMSVVGLRTLPRIWRHETKFYDRVPSWWVWGEAAWRAWTRLLPIGTVGFVGCIAIWVVAEHLPRADWHGFVLPPWFVVPALIAYSTLAVLGITIVLFNWPKALVARRLRDDPGALQEWLGGRGSKRRTGR